MPPRPTWKGFLQLSLVSIPVHGYTAASSTESPIRLNQLHADCHERIRYVKTCPVHGEVPLDEIELGYEYERGHYVVIDPAEVDQLRTDRDRAVAIDAFVPEEAVSPLHYAGKTYYLLPDGSHAQKPYALVREAMTAERLCGLAQVVISTREQLVLVRPIDGVLAMSILTYDAQLRKPEQFAEELTQPKLSAEELKLTRQLLRGLERDDVDLADYRDEYDDQLRQLVEAKREGKELAAPRSSEPPPVINLMDALKASVKDVKSPARSKTPAKPSAARKIAAKRTQYVRSTLKKKRRKSG
jgi:DNA end-binding protein Ku